MVDVTSNIPVIFYPGLHELFEFIRTRHHFQCETALVRSSLPDDLIKWVLPSVRPSVHPSVNNSVFLFPPYYMAKLKLCRVILDISAHNRSVPDFAISTQVAP